MTLNDSGMLTIAGGSTTQNNRIMITLSPTTGLGIYINGRGYSGLGFVDDGNGHVVLGK
jgi:predicted NBD/HSP70 family sugar kinase